MKALALTVVLACCTGVTGCATTEGPAVADVAATPANIIAAGLAANAVTVGKSTKADVIAALGKTTTISFDSGFEVWVYQIKSDAPVRSSLLDRFGFGGAGKTAASKAEYVVLFAPSGLAAKTRLRAAPPPSEPSPK